MKTSLICTVLNEESTVRNLIHSIVNQTKNPDEVIIVDGGSKDKTIPVLKDAIKSAHKNGTVFKTLIAKGNRSIGRNYAIEHATGEVILCTDAGCTLDTKWVENILKPFVNKKTDVVAGYYNADAATVFQKCVTPFALVMPDRVDSTMFLPATRSMALYKQVWKDVGGFNESYSHNEDYVFAREVRKKSFTIFFQKDAIVYWIPPKTFSSAFRMMYRFAFGDIESGIIRGKVVFIFARYAFVVILLCFTVYFRSMVLLIILIALFLAYVFWAIIKNEKYVGNKQGYYLLPLLQFTADYAVLSGSTLGALQRLKAI